MFPVILMANAVCFVHDFTTSVASCHVHCNTKCLHSLYSFQIYCNFYLCKILLTSSIVQNET